MSTGEEHDDEVWDFVKQGGLDISHSQLNVENTGQFWGSQTKKYVESVLTVPQKHSDNVGTYNNNFNTEGSGTGGNDPVAQEQSNVPVTNSNVDSSVNCVHSTESTQDFDNSRILTESNCNQFPSASSHDVKSDRLNTMGTRPRSQSSSKSNVNHKQMPLSESSNKSYRCIKRSKLDDKSDNRLNMGKERVPGVSTASFPSPSDSNIRIDPIHNPTPNEGSFPRNNGTDTSREETGSGTQQRVPSTVFCLDVCENMRGRAFQEMIDTAKTIVTGLQAVAVSHEEKEIFQENIAIATFGHETKVLVHLTKDYEGILSKIDTLTPGGACSVKEGLAMAMTAFSGHFERSLLPKVILISNGNAPLDKAESATGQNVTDAVEVDAGQVLQEFIQLTVRIFCIPVGEARLTVLEQLSEMTGGKIIQTRQTHRIVSMTRAFILGYEIAGNFDDTVNRETRKYHLETIGYGQSEDERENILDQIEYINRVYVKERFNRRKYEERDPSMPDTGKRVRRGPHWKHNNQDSDGVGTVIGHHKTGVLLVEWDTGIRGTYVYTETEHEVVVVREQRTLFEDQMVAVGCLVKRGKDWNHGNFDGGPEYTGVVLGVTDDGTVLVRWQNKKLHGYKFGYDGIFEVEICPLAVLEHQPVPLPPPPGTSCSPQFSNGALEQERIGTKQNQNFTKSSSRPETQINNPRRGVAGCNFEGDSAKADINEKNIRNVSCSSQRETLLSSSSSSSSSSQRKEDAANFVLLEARQHVWQYQGGRHRNSEWVSYPPDMQQKVESAYLSQRKGALVLLNGQQYRVIFKEMVQRRLNTEEVYCVRRIPCMLLAL